MLYLLRRDRSNVRYLATPSHRRPRRRRPAFEGLEAKSLLSSLYVATTGSDTAGGSALHPWATLQRAANAVAPGDTVHVAPGTYNGAVTTRTSGTASARITFISDVPWGAKIRTTGAGSCWTTKGNYIDIQGFDISGAGSTGIENYGAYCRFVGNHIHDIPDPGGLSSAGYTVGSYVTAHDNDIIGNWVDHIGTATPANLGHHGVGIYIAVPGERVLNNIVENNGYYGIHAWHAATNGTIANNLVFGNQMSGILVGAGDAPGGVTADNFVVSNNISIYNHRHGIVEEGQTGTHNVYLNNCVYGNTLGTFVLQNGLKASGTVVADPKFVNYRADGTGDYHLAAGSPCIDAGTAQGAPATDYAGVARPQGAGIDIGLHGWVPQSTASPASSR